MVALYTKATPTSIRPTMAASCNRSTRGLLSLRVSGIHLLVVVEAVVGSVCPICFRAT